MGNFVAIRNWIKKSKEEDTQWEKQMSDICSTPVDVTLTEKILAYGVVSMVFGFITYMLIL